MRTSDHFYSELNALERRNRGAAESKIAEDAARSFSALVAPLVGADLADEAFSYWLERYGRADPPLYSKLGHIAAFFLDDYDDQTMDLGKEDWKALKDIVANAAEDLDIDVLSQLMTDLVSRGALRD